MFFFQRWDREWEEQMAEIDQSPPDPLTGMRQYERIGVVRPSTTFFNRLGAVVICLGAAATVVTSLVLTYFEWTADEQRPILFPLAAATVLPGWSIAVFGMIRSGLYDEPGGIS